MEIQVLGPVELRSNGTEVAVGGPRQRRLLAALVVNAGRVVSVERLIDVVWAGEEPPEYGTLVTAALLILALAFAGYWIYSYVGDTGAPLTRWFVVAAVAIVVLGILNYVRMGRNTR